MCWLVGAGVSDAGLHHKWQIDTLNSELSGALYYNWKDYSGVYT